MSTTFRSGLLLLLSLVLVGTAAPPPAASMAPAADAVRASASAGLQDRMVLVISVDGLSRRVVKQLGREQLPAIHRLVRRGVSTLNARSQPERTITLPNHVSMMTGRRVNPRRGGHGVRWNYDDRDRTVHSAAGEWVASAFSQVHAAGGTTAVFATKSKFSIFKRSWPEAVDRNFIRDGKDLRVTRRLRAHLRNAQPSFALLHLGNPDGAGHESGWMSRRYRRVVRRTDHKIGRVLQTRRENPELRRKLTIILTSDHGGVPGTTSHSDNRHPENYRIPFIVFGRPVGRGNVYARSPDYLRPRRAWIPAKGQQPVRNGDAANLAMDVLGLEKIPGSLWGTDQQLDWRR